MAEWDLRLQTGQWYRETKIEFFRMSDRQNSLVVMLCCLRLPILFIIDLPSALKTGFNHS